MRLILILLMISMLPCFAQLGGNEEDCAKAYGKADPAFHFDYNEGADHAALRLFHYERFKISVTFLNGIAVKVFVTITDNAGTFTEDETSDILKRSAGGMDWKKPPSADYTIPLWKRSDDATASICGYGTSFLLETSQAETADKIIDEKS